jgi:hypothetical protein
MIDAVRQALARDCGFVSNNRPLESSGAVLKL